MLPLPAYRSANTDCSRQNDYDKGCLMRSVIYCILLKIDRRTVFFTRQKYSNRCTDFLPLVFGSSSFAENRTTASNNGSGFAGQFPTSLEGECYSQLFTCPISQVVADVAACSASVGGAAPASSDGSDKHIIQIQPARIIARTLQQHIKLMI